MILSIASGKGGTGKTLVATNIAASLGQVQLVDCDVEEPNAYLFFPEAKIMEAVEAKLPVPVVDLDKCTRCKECSRFCAYHALAALPQEILIFPELCHGCGGCTLACPERAISEGSRSIGKILRASYNGLGLLWGELNLGEPTATPLIKQVKEKAKSGLILVDCPPGTACPVIEALSGSDFCLLVTEPTPFGLYDLDLAVKMCKVMSIPCGILVNKSGLGDRKVYSYCQKNNLSVLMEIPIDRRIAKIYSQGSLLVREMPEWIEPFRDLVSKIEEMIS